MRYPIGLTILIISALVLGACGGDDDKSGDTPATTPGGPNAPDPSSDVPPVVDTAGMTREQLEAKVQEIEDLMDAKMLELKKLSTGRVPGAVDAETARKAGQVSADMRALTAQMRTYDEALDALD